MTELKPALIKRLNESGECVDALRDKLRAVDGSGVYNGVTKQEALRVFQTSPSADNYFTRLNKGYRLEVKEYREAYPEYFAAIAGSLRNAAGEADDQTLNEQLLRMGDALVNSSIPMEELYRATLITVDSPVRVFLGWEEYDDEWKMKASPIFWVDELMVEDTQRLRDYLDIAREAYQSQYTDKPIPDVKLRVSEPLITSRMFREMRFSANTQPNYLEWILRNRAPAVITMMDSLRERNFKQDLLPTAKTFIHPDIISRYTDERLREAHRRILALHELGHPLTKIEFGELKELRNVRLIYHELYPTTMALSLAQQFDPDYVEPMLIIATSWAVSDFRHAFRPERDDYAIGEAGLMLGFGLENRVFEVVKDRWFRWASLPRVLRVMDDLNALQREPMRGDYERAKEILQDYNGFPALHDIMRRRDLPDEELIEHDNSPTLLPV